jgi:hypothetical protein
VAGTLTPMAISSPPNPAATVRPGREWHPLQAVYLGAAALALFVVAFWSALGKPPLGGTNVEWVLGFLLVSLVNLGLGTLGGGAVIEWRHPTWSRLGLADHIFMAIALVVLVAADVGFAWWLFSSTAGAFSRWVFLIIALIAIALGAWSVWHPLPFVSGHPPKALWPARCSAGPTPRAGWSRRRSAGPARRRSASSPSPSAATTPSSPASSNSASSPPIACTRNSRPRACRT